MESALGVFSEAEVAKTIVDADNVVSYSIAAGDVFMLAPPER